MNPVDLIHRLADTQADELASACSIAELRQARIRLTEAIEVLIDRCRPDWHLVDGPVA